MTGCMLGMQGDSMCNSALSKKFDATRKANNRMQWRLKDIAAEFEGHGASASDNASILQHTSMPIRRLGNELRKQS